MSACRPGAVVTVAGRRCVVLRDAVVHTLPPADDIVVLDRLDGRMVYCALSELKRAREQHPGLPAYGFWQLLLGSGLVDKGERLQTVYLDGRNGQYLYQDAPAVVFSGEIRDGVLIANGGYAPDPDTARAIVCEVQNLRLPRKAALSFEERERERAARKFRFALQLTSVAAALGVALLIYNGKRHAYDAEQETLRDALAVRAEALAAHKAALEDLRISHWPDQRRTLDELLHLALAFEKFTVPETPLDHSAFEARTPDTDTRLPPLVSGIVESVGHRRDGALSLRWSRAR